MSPSATTDPPPYSLHCVWTDSRGKSCLRAIRFALLAGDHPTGERIVALVVFCLVVSLIIFSFHLRAPTTRLGVGVASRPLRRERRRAKSDFAGGFPSTSTRVWNGRIHSLTGRQSVGRAIYPHVATRNPFQSRCPPTEDIYKKKKKKNMKTNTEIHRTPTVLTV